MSLAIGSVNIKPSDTHTHHNVLPIYKTGIDRLRHPERLALALSYRHGMLILTAVEVKTSLFWEISCKIDGHDEII